MNLLRRFAPLVALGGAIGAVVLWNALSSRPAQAAPRAITPRGPLTAEEQQNIDVFETW
jgi:hypothetical protein